MNPYQKLAEEGNNGPESRAAVAIDALTYITMTLSAIGERHQAGDIEDEDEVTVSGMMMSTIPHLTVLAMSTYDLVHNLRHELDTLKGDTQND